MNEIEVKKAFNLLADHCNNRDTCVACCILKPGPICRCSDLKSGYKFDIPGDVISHPINHPIDNLISHPSHYTDGNIEVWDFIADKKLNFFSGNAIKYVCRAGKKDPDKRIEDLKKARAYIDKQIELWESESE